MKIFVRYGIKQKETDVQRFDHFYIRNNYVFRSMYCGYAKSESAKLRSWCACVLHASSASVLTALRA